MGGVTKYTTALRVQNKLVEQIQKNAGNDTLVIVQHPPVYTTGMRTKEYSVEEERRLLGLGADFVRTNRGGLITFHGPGQLVVYPILNLKHFLPHKGSEGDRRVMLRGMKWYVERL